MSLIAIDDKVVLEDGRVGRLISINPGHLDLAYVKLENGETIQVFYMTLKKWKKPRKKPC